MNRVASIDALRGVVMFTMIVVNDLAGASDRIVPAWMKHFHGRSGMTFVDLVFPAFLFIVGMSMPFALGGRWARGESRLRTVGHIGLRTVSLLAIGILMVNETPDSGKMGWSGTLWCTLMYLSAIAAFGTIAPPAPVWNWISRTMRGFGVISLVLLAFAFRGEDGHRIVSLDPLAIHTEWYGILGLIGWAYLVGAVLFLFVGTQRTALLGCVVLLMCLYPAERAGAFEHFWLARWVGIGTTLGSQAAITVAGMLLGTILITPADATVARQARFTGWFIAGFSAAAWLLQGLYGINKNSATPSWCLWACAITAAAWLMIHGLARAAPTRALTGLLAVAGSNVLLAYLLSELLPSLIDLVGLGGWYGGLAEPTLARALARSAGLGVVLLASTAGLNRVGFRLRL